MVGLLDLIVRKQYGAQVTLHHRTACTNVKWAEDKVELTVQLTTVRLFIRISTCPKNVIVYSNKYLPKIPCYERSVQIRLP